MCFYIMENLLPTHMSHLAHQALRSLADQIMAPPRLSFLGGKILCHMISQAISLWRLHIYTVMI